MSRSYRRGYSSDARNLIRGGGSGTHNFQSHIPIRQGQDTFRRHGYHGSNSFKYTSPTTLMRAVANTHAIEANKLRRTSNPEKRTSLDSPMWHKWTVMFGVKYDKAWLMGRLTQAIPFSILPVNVKNDQRNVVFFVKMSRAQITTARQSVKGVTDEQGREIVVDVSSRDDREPELPDLNEESVKENIRQALRNRYIEASVCLNLHAFHEDASLAECGLYIPLNKNTVMDFVAETVIYYLSSLMQLNLSSNLLRRVDGFKNFFEKFTMIEKLDLSDNPLADKSCLIPAKPCFQRLKILNLSNTQLALKPKSLWKSEIESYFPNAVIITSEVGSGPQQQSVRFEIQKVEEKTKQLPPPVIAYFVNDDAGQSKQKMIMEFLVNYLRKFDSDRRQLMEYYQPSSVLTMHCGLHALVPPDSKKIDHAMFNQHNRNLIRLKDPERRKSTVKSGDLQIVAFMDSLPKTEHHLAEDGTFSVEVSLQTDNAIVLHFNGLYHELSPGKSGSDSVSKILRVSSHCMIIVPPMQIINHDILITNPSNSMIKKVQMTNAASSSSSSAVDLSKAKKALLVYELMSMTGMNEAFSEKCLSEFDWNISAAQQVVSQMKATNQLPPEAFTQ